MSKLVAISQSNYIPWRGYFDMINSVDIFVLYDEMQYTRRDWRNRNKIIVQNKTHWLTIPVDVKGKYFQKIKDTKVADPNWARKHWSTIKNAYSKAQFFNNYADELEEFYLGSEFTYLTDINLALIRIVNKFLDIQTEIIHSSSFKLDANPTENLLDICETLGADTYVSGPAAKNYFDMNEAEKRSIQINWMDYSQYAKYPQMTQSFEPSVSVLDMLFNVGNNKPEVWKKNNWRKNGTT